MAQRKPPEMTVSFVGLESVRQRRPRRAKAEVFQVPPEHLEGIRRGRDDIREGRVIGEAAFDALLAPRQADAAAVVAIPAEHLDGIREGRAQIRRGEITDEAEVQAMLAPRRP